MNPAPDFFERLKLQRVTLLWLLLVVLAFSFLGAFSLIVLVANALNGIDPWQEASAFRLILVVSFISVTAYLVALAYAVLRRPGVVTLARLVEERHPELRESLSTAVEIQQKHGGPTNALEAALFQSVEERTKDINFRTATLPQRLHPLLVIGLVLGSFFLSSWARESAVMVKAQYYFADLRNGENTGLTIVPGSADAPSGSDLDITATINRWRLEAFIDTRIDGEVETYPMAMAGERDFTFTAYALEDNFDYRVRTPSLESDWFTVTVYDPPEIDAVEINVTPPAYTGEEPLQFTQLLDLFAPEASAVKFALTTAPGIDTWLRVGEEEYPFDDEVMITAEETTEYQFRLRNAEGREAVTESYLLEVKPDEPPTVAMIEPGSDIQALLDEIVPLEVYAADDYGISRVEIEISVSGLMRRPIQVFDAKEGPYPQEHNGLPNLEVSRLGVEFGDVITYFAKVWDNKEPEPQMARSEIYFIEAVEQIDNPDQEQPEGGGGGGGGGGEREEDVDIRGIITELKRLIRLGYRADSEVGERRTLGSQELGASLAKVATESNNLLAQVGAILGTVDEGKPYEMFLDAIYKMVEAEELANANQPGEATVPMQESMSMLIRLEKYLQALFPPQQQGGGGGGQGQPSPGQGEGESEESEGESGMSISEMQEALEEMNQLADQQAAMNRRFDRASQSMGESERNELQKMQEALGDKVNELAGEMSKLMQGSNVREALRGASGQMSQAAGAAGSGDGSRAGRAGSRARQGLIDAASLLDERIRSEATSAIAGLAQQAERLAQGQGAAAADSRGAQAGNIDDDRKDALKEQQREINDGWDKLRQEMEQLTGDLGKVFPEAAESLDNVARNMRDENIDRNLSRASNALLYGRYSRAAGSQDAAAEGMAEISQQLDQAAGTLPGLSPGELRQLLERVAQARQQLAQQGEGGEGQGEQSGNGESGQSEAAGQASGEGQSGQGQQPGQGQQQGQGESGQASAQGQGQGEGDAPGQGQSGEGRSPFGGLGDSISDAGRALKDTNLEELGSKLNAAKGGEGGGGATTATVLDATARTLQEYLRKEIGEQRMRFKQEGGPPPEKYRELVEEYFRDLAEEPSNP